MPFLEKRAQKCPFWEKEPKNVRKKRWNFTAM